MTDRLKHETGMKKGIYKRIKERETHLRDRYNEQIRSVSKKYVKSKRITRLE